MSVSSHTQERICTITIERPEKLNALDYRTLQALDAAFTEAGESEEIRVIIVTGAGDRAFIAGADIAEMSALSPLQARDFSLAGQHLMRRIERLSKPVIAMVNGFALGGGLELALACHLRIAAENARLGQPEVNLGLIPGFGGTQRLLRLAGRTAALELCLLGTPITAEQALQLGIVNRVLPLSELQAATYKIATHLAHAAPQALRAVLDAIHIGSECTLNEGLEYESMQFGLLFSTDDMHEGTRAFLERRRPTFNNS